MNSQEQQLWTCAAGLVFALFIPSCAHHTVDGDLSLGGVVTLQALAANPIAIDDPAAALSSLDRSNWPTLDFLVPLDQPASFDGPRNTSIAADAVSEQAARYPLATTAISPRDAEPAPLRTAIAPIEASGEVIGLVIDAFAHGRAASHSQLIANRQRVPRHTTTIAGSEGNAPADADAP